MMLRSEQDPASRLHGMKFRFGMYLVFTSLLIVVFIGLAANALVNDHYRNDPGTQIVTATVTRTARDCTKSGCYYDSYGTYSIYGTPERDSKVIWLSPRPVTGQVPVLVNLKRPKIAMPYGYNPYPREALAAAAFAGFFIVWNSFLYLVFYRRTKRRLETQIS